MRRLNNKGFTLVEISVVAAIIAVLAGVLVPMIMDQVGESRIARANADIRTIESAIMQLRKDTGRWPVWADNGGGCVQSIQALKTNGNLPPAVAGGPYNPATFNPVEISTILRDSNACYPNWKGPYLPTANSDPWDNAYIIHVDAMRDPAVSGLPDGKPVWIFSAGEDKQVSSDPANDADGLDGDIGKRIK